MTETRIPDLQAAREAIEKVDRDLMAKLKERMKLVERIASLKIESAFPFRDQLREEQVLQRVRHTAVELGLDPHEMERLYRHIMEMSISHQLDHIRSTGVTPLRVAYQGVEGSYSHLAAQRHYRERKGGVLLTGYETFRQAAEAVLDGSDDLALLPIENSTAGSINETYDLLSSEKLTINAEVISHIGHCLMALPGTRLEDLRVVLSHPQALLQCESALQKLPWIRPQAEFDTAGSARKVRESNDPTMGAIASENAARTFGLEILQRDIQTERGNYTRFVEVATEAARCPPGVPCKTSLLFAVGHQPGDLSRVLTEFSRRGINMTKLESRPIPSKAWTYRFYLDLEGHVSSAPLSEALEAIRPHTVSVRILGTYPRAESPNPPPADDDIHPAQ